MSEQYRQIGLLIRWADLFLEDAQWEQAEACCRSILDIAPENAWAYSRRLFAKYRIRNAVEFLLFARQNRQQIMDDPDTQSVLRFGTEDDTTMIRFIDADLGPDFPEKKLQVLSNSFAAVLRGHFDVALHNFTLLEKYYSSLDGFWFRWMMAKLQCRDLYELVNKGYPISKNPEFLKALSCSNGFQQAVYQSIAKQVLFATHIKCQTCLTEQAYPKENWVNWMQLYCNHCEPEDPYGKIYRTLLKIPTPNWNHPLITGALIHIQDIYRKEMAAGRLIELTGQQFTGGIRSYIQAPGKYLHLEAVIEERLKQTKSEIPTGQFKGSLIPPTPSVVNIPLKALRNPAKPLPGKTDYVSGLLWEYREKKKHTSLSPFTGKHYTPPLTPNYIDNDVRCWCEPDCVFSRASGLELLPIPEGAVTQGEPQGAWQRYVHISRQITATHLLVLCAKKVQELAPDELAHQTALRDKLLDQLVAEAKGAPLAQTLKTMQELYPQDYRTHYVCLRQLTGEFQTPRSFKASYRRLSSSLSQLKKRDAEGAQKLKQQYIRLSTDILDYTKPFALAAETHAAPISSKQEAEQLPFCHRHMLNDWLRWWQPLKKETDELLIQIGQDAQILEAIINKKQRRFSLFKR